MTMNMNLEGVFLGATSETYNRKADNQPVTIYRASIKQGAEVGTLGCTEAVYKAYQAGVIQDFQKCTLSLTYTDRFGRPDFRLTDVIPRK